jgi:hypothetical protein
MSRPPTPVGRGWVGDEPGEERDRYRHRKAVAPPTKPQVTIRDMPDMPAVRSRYEHARMAGTAADEAGQGWDESKRAAVNRSWQDVSDLHDSLRVVAADVLALAQVGGMPDSYWLTDARVKRACEVLGVAPEHARDMDWAE